MKNWARYLLLFYHVVAIVDTLFVLSKIPPIASAVGITLSLFVIVWLLHRKPIFVNPNETIKSVI